MENLPGTERLRGRGSVSALFDEGRRGASGVIAARVAPNGLAFSRLAAVSGRKLGGAVMRNRMRRLLRAAFRTQKSILPVGLDVVLIARPGLLEARWQDVLDAVREAVRKAAKAGGEPGRRR